MTLERASNLSIDRVFSLGKPGLGQDDLAVGQLVNAVSPNVAIPATIATTPPNGTDTLTQVGFGCTDRDSQAGGGVKRYKTFQRDNLNDISCFGDSGGPIFYGTVGGVTGMGAITLIASGFKTVTPGDDYDLYGVPSVHRSEIFNLKDALSRDGICYRTHVAGIGWLDAVCNGTVSGTTGQSRAIEAIQIWSNRPGVKVCYKAHLGGVGWQGQVCDSDMAGTIGQSRAIEAIVVSLPSNPQGSSLSYAAHVGGIGWQGAVGAGAVAGTTGQSRAMEAFTITMTP